MATGTLTMTTMKTKMRMKKTEPLGAPVSSWKTPIYPKLTDYDEYSKRDPNMIHVGPGVSYDQHEVYKDYVSNGPWSHEYVRYRYFVNGKLIDTRIE